MRAMGTGGRAATVRGAWSEPGLPRRGWVCVEIADLGALDGECEFCGEPIRYEHHMGHSEVHREYVAGCICAGKLEGDYVAPKERERLMRNRAARRERWTSRKWRQSRKGNYYLNVAGRNVGVYRDPVEPALWRARIGDRFGTLVYATKENAMRGIFDRLYPVRSLTKRSTPHG